MNKPNKTELEYFIRYSLDSGKYKRYMELYEEIERLHSIIKEVRGKLYDLNYKVKEIYNVPFDISEIFEMIEILDKENNNEDN